MIGKIIEHEGYEYPYEVPWDGHNHKMIEIDEWCEVMFGLERMALEKYSVKVNDRWTTINNGWRFKEYDDAIMFVLALN